MDGCCLLTYIFVVGPNIPNLMFIFLFFIWGFLMVLMTHRSFRVDWKITKPCKFGFLNDPWEQCIWWFVSDLYSISPPPKVIIAQQIMNKNQQSSLSSRSSTRGTPAPRGEPGTRGNPAGPFPGLRGCFPSSEARACPRPQLEKNPGKCKDSPCETVPFQKGNYIWLVVSTHLNNISQNGNLPQIGMNIKTIWNHHLDIVFPTSNYHFSGDVELRGCKDIVTPPKQLPLSSIVMVLWKITQRMKGTKIVETHPFSTSMIVGGRVTWDW